MPLDPKEIVPGAVAILETESLIKHLEVRRAEDDVVFRTGPFLCVQARDGRSAWLNLTTQKDARGLRLELKPEWLLDGSKKWRSASQYIHDARKPFVGPNDAFVAAAANELPFTWNKRPRVAEEGVAAAIQEMQKYGADAL